MKDLRNANDMVSCFRPDTGDNGTGTWHEVSQLPISELKSRPSKLPSTNSTNGNLTGWRGMSGMKAPEFGRERVTYGDLDDDIRHYADEPVEDGVWETDSDTEFVIRCCGDDRPLRKRGQKLEIKPSESFVTVKDYVSGV